MSIKLEVNRREITNPFVKVLVVAGAFLFVVGIVAWVLFFILPLIGIVVGTTLAMVGTTLAMVGLILAAVGIAVAMVIIGGPIIGLIVAPFILLVSVLTKVFGKNRERTG